MQRTSKALREVVEREQALALRNHIECLPVSRLTEQVDADQRPRPQSSALPNLRDAVLQMAGIDLESARIDIDEYRRGTHHQWDLGGSGIGEGRQEHRVARARCLPP